VTARRSEVATALVDRKLPFAFIASYDPDVRSGNVMCLMRAEHSQRGRIPTIG
jgi:hypothetical protein